MSKEKLVFVKHYIMLGDADGSVDGFAVIEKDIWEAEKALFQKFLDHEDTEEVEIEEQDMYGHMSMKCYEEKSCTEEEAKVIKKFFGKSYDKKVFAGDGFRWLTDWMPWEYKEANGIED